MCHQCLKKPVYEFTNQRKLCARCFVNWFEKKFLYTLRKFKMIKNGDIILYKNNGSFQEVVLENLLKIFAEKGDVKLINLPAHLHSQIDTKLLMKNFSDNKNSAKNRDKVRFGAINKRGEAERFCISSQQVAGSRVERISKTAIPSTTDSESEKIIKSLIKEKEKDLDKSKPIKGKIIKPLYLFLDEEILLYAKLKKLKFRNIKEKKNKISEFLDGLEKKHPEVKHSIVNGLLDIPR